MHDFHYKNEVLHCEEVSVQELAGAVGTPFYLYSNRTLTNHYRVFDESFSGMPHLICYALKANSNLALLRIFIRNGAGLDIVSGGELFRGIRAGVDPAKVVYSGVGKKIEEIDAAIAAGILMFNVESSQELEVINDRARQSGIKAGIALRVNPDVNPETHPYISTGLRENKFGIDIQKSLEQYRHAAKLPWLDIKGVSCHIGSQITKIAPFVDALEKLKILMNNLKKEGFNIRYLDLGGGLGITYNEETPPHPVDYARALMDAGKDLDCTFIFEPGRVIVGNAGIMVTSVLYTKNTDQKNFVIVDAGMNDLIRPSLYSAYQFIQPVIRRAGEEIVADIVGPICESGDFLAKGRRIPRLERGELAAVMSAGAYGFAMASNYNSRPRVPEVLVSGDKYFVIRKREQYEDLIRGEEIPGFLRDEE
ncbi:MAG: diaminopimelate decarboxylase [Smithellaceae bacterium]|nr:diaminopimelate decarboxylase [Smithellaceae bacterium]